MRIESPFLADTVHRYKHLYEAMRACISSWRSVQSCVIVVNLVTCRGVWRVCVSPGSLHFLRSFTLRWLKIAGVDWNSVEGEGRRERWWEEGKTGISEASEEGIKAAFIIHSFRSFRVLPRTSSGASSFHFFLPVSLWVNTQLSLCTHSNFV